jgi:ELWxxDGT repeat protein
LFTANDGADGTELWKSDGTSAGTVMVSDINAGPASSFPTSLCAVGTWVYFAADDGTDGIQLWRSDGTAGGTSMVDNISAGSGSSYPTSLTNVNGTLFFQAQDPTHGVELWKSDGTAAGTVLVKDIVPGAGSSYPSNLTVAGGLLYFTATTGTAGTELWASDGTSAGTYQVADVWPGLGSSNPVSLTYSNATLYFIANDGTHGPQLWQTDGTAGGTQAADPSGTGTYTPQVILGTTSGGIAFIGSDPVNGNQLWVLTPGPATPPVVSGISPSTGPTSGGTAVTLTGTGFTDATAVYFGGAPATRFTVNGDGSITAIAPAAPAGGTVDVTVFAPGGTSATTASDQFTYTAVAPAPLLVGLPVINGDNPNGLYAAAGQSSPGTQRSMVEDVVYTFNEPVVIHDANLAFTVIGTGAHAGTAPATLYAQAVTGSNGTQWAVSLTGMPEGTIASIANGEYSITINAAYVFAAADGTTTLRAGRTDTFYRLYGDVFGTESVNLADYNLFKKSINTYNPMFDFFGNGQTSSLGDYNVFKKDLNISFYGDGFVTTV